MDVPIEIPLGPAKDYIVSFGHLKVTKDKCTNDKEKNETKETKRTVSSKLPLTSIRSNSSSRKAKSTSAGTSRQTQFAEKSKTDTLVSEEKYKPSLIPRRRTAKGFHKEPVSLQAINKNISSRLQSLIKQTNIQRVQLLNINPDFCPEPPKSVLTARPIPSLGHVNAQDSSNDTLSDLYLESAEYLDIPQESNEPNATINIDLQSGGTSKPNENVPNNGLDEDRNNRTNMKTFHITDPLKIFKFTNENVSDWISSELDNSTKDDESGYRSMSPPQRAVICCDTKANHSTILRIPHDDKQYVFHSTVKKSVSTTAITKDNNSDYVFGNQATVIISKGNRDSLEPQQYFNVPKVNTDVRAFINSKLDIHKPVKYHSTPNPLRKREDIKVPVPSYVEYPSEVLQKTTNFESEAYATSNNIAGPDLNIYDTNPSQWTLNHLDDTYSVPTDDTVWSRLQSSQESSLIESSKTSYLTEESCFNNQNETPRTKCPDKYSYHDYYNHYCWRKEVAKKTIDDQCPWDFRGRCKICQKYRKAPNRSIHRPFQTLKSRICLGKNYKHGWSRVWKKTTERWAHWSRSPSRFGKQSIKNWRKSLIWDNANVQTTILVYRETDSSTTSSKHKKSQIKHVNIGPSMFPFLYYPSTVLAARSLSRKPSHHNTRSDQNSSENKLKDLKKLKSPRNLTLGNKSIEETRRGISKSTSLIAVPNYVIENGTVTENATGAMENKVTSTMINFSHIKLADTVSQDACTQVFITCNNAATDIKYAPTVVSGSTSISKDNDEAFYYGIDRGTEVIPLLNKSQRSISIMTSKGIIQELTDKDTQVLTVPSIRKISTTVLAQEHYKDAKSSVVTDTTVPCRRFENILVTSKGTILSCTGTKVTSVSSAQIQSASETTRMSRIYTVNRDNMTETTTTHGTVGLIKSEKSTSCSLKTFADAGESATNLVSRASYNGGSHRTFNSFCTAKNILTLQNTDCLTSPSLYRNHLEDICLGTDELESTSEKSTSCALKTFADAGTSASKFVDRASFNGGSHHTLISFCTAIHPECTSACMNTDLKLNDQSTKSGLSFEKCFEKANKSTRDCCAQYSEPFNRSSNDTCAWDQSNSRCLANIGRSRLMSVRMLSDSVTEMATQVEPVFHCAETNTTFKPKKSTCVSTSRYSIDRSNSTVEAHPLPSNSKVHPKDTEGVLTCHCTKNECVCKTIDVDESSSQVLSPVPSDVACKTNGLKSVLSLTTQTEPEVSLADSNSEPNAVISSKLNATKWMKGCIKESVKDVKSIISISETMVAESLDRASLVIASSKDRKIISEMKKLSKVLINHQPAISCVTATGYNPSTSVSITKLLPIIDKTNTQEEQTPMNKQTENDIMIVNQMKSDDNTTNEEKEPMPQLHPTLCDTDENTTKNIKESVPQLQTNLCDTVSNTGYHATPSVSVSKLLPTKDQSIIEEEQNVPIKTQNHNDVVMVNQMTSDENTTTHIKESIPQLHPNLRDTATDCNEKRSEQHSASVLTSRHILASPPRCSNTCDNISRDCIFVYDHPRCVVHSFFTDAKAQTDVHHRNSDITCKKPGSISNRSIGLATSFGNHFSCSRQKSCIVGDVLSPKVYKALYETTKLIAKDGSATTTPKSSTVQATTKKPENEDAIRVLRAQSNGVSQMTSCLLSAPAHCCCARCLNSGNTTSKSIQTEKKSLLCCPHCNARISRSYGNRENMKNRSIQAVADSFLDCPQCSAKIALLSNDSHHESTEECMESYLVASCRYYSNLLTIKLGQVKENFIKHLAPPIEETSHHATVTIPNNISHCTLSNNNIIFTEACTMKPSGKQDENCQAKFLKQMFNQHSCILFPALSLTDVRGNDKNDLKNVYYILTAIEGRVRRLRNNLTY